jgi:hypothetical protein
MQSVNDHDVVLDQVKFVPSVEYKNQGPTVAVCAVDVQGEVKVWEIPRQ